jgi:predicted RNA binding protein YcfA (HicA-like mRNA interferase family)
VADHSIKLKKLRRILRRFGVQEDTSRGKGSHTTFLKTDSAGKVIAIYTVPTTRKDVLVCYIQGYRKRFSLRPQDGVADEDFYSH